MRRLTLPLALVAALTLGIHALYAQALLATEIGDRRPGRGHEGQLVTGGNRRTMPPARRHQGNGQDGQKGHPQAKKDQQSHALA